MRTLPMLDPNFDPYEIIINLQNRVNLLERNQTEIIKGLRHSQQTLEIIMNSVKQLQSMSIELSQDIYNLKERLNG